MAWLDRIAAAGSRLWKNAGIYDTIMLSRGNIRLDRALFLSISQFWSISTNSFHLRNGMMAPTLQDVAFHTGFHPHGEEVDKYVYPNKKKLSYSGFLFAVQKSSVVSDHEHISFLIYWLKKIVFCVLSQKITEDFTELAKALSLGRKLAIGPLVLAHL